MSSNPSFTPVPLRARRDGWTPERQVAFIAALAQTRCVTAACQAVGKSWQTAYRLRARPNAASFAAAWDAALAGPPLDRAFTGRAMGGIAKPITYRGRQVGERRRFDNRLAIFILRRRAPGRYGAEGEHRPAAASGWTAAIATLEAELAAGLAPCDEPDSRHDVARTSSPSASRPIDPGSSGPPGRARLAEQPFLRYGRGVQRAVLAEEGAEDRSSRAVFASARSPPHWPFARMPRSAWGGRGSIGLKTAGTNRPAGNDD